MPVGAVQVTCEGTAPDHASARGLRNQYQGLPDTNVQMRISKSWLTISAAALAA